VNFDWPDLSGVLDKVEEEIRELKQALGKEDRANMQEELGDIIFSLVNLARFLELSAEDALRLTNEKFIKRFQFIEEYFQQDYEKMKQAKLAELDLIWNRSKEQ